MELACCSHEWASKGRTACPLRHSHATHPARPFAWITEQAPLAGHGQAGSSSQPLPQLRLSMRPRGEVPELRAARPSEQHEPAGGQLQGACCPYPTPSSGPTMLDPPHRPHAPPGIPSPIGPPHPHPPGAPAPASGPRSLSRHLSMDAACMRHLGASQHAGAAPKLAPQARQTSLGSAPIPAIAEEVRGCCIAHACEQAGCMPLAFCLLLMV